MLLSLLLPSAFEGRPARHLLVFYKQLAALGLETGYIGEPAYFTPPADLRGAGRGEWEPSWHDAYEYSPPAHLDGVRRALLPDDLFTERLRRLRSPWKLFGQMLTRRLPELEAACDKAIDELSHGERPEAILTFSNSPSLEAAAARRGIPVVHNEFGPLRKPGWVLSGYWDRRGVSSRTDVGRRLAAFRRERARSPLPLLTRPEILRTLRRAPLPESVEPQAARYKVGVALQGEEIAHVHGFSGVDLVAMARLRYGRDQILVRNHPGAVTFYSEAFGTADHSASCAEFVQQCETVATVNSGVAFEALLLGRRVVLLGDGPFKVLSDRSFDDERRRSERATLEALNFLAFGYLVPCALMFDPAYIRWRLSDPPELEIVRFHQQWYQRRTAPLLAGDDPAVALSAGLKLLHGAPPVGSDVFLFGAGSAASHLLTGLPPDWRVRGVFDNDPARYADTVAGVPISAPAYHGDATVVISSLTYAAPMMAQLRALGYPADRIVRFA